MMSQTYEHPNGAFSLTLPDDRDYAVQKSTIAFFQPEIGVGAINVSAMVPTKGIVDPAVIAFEFTPKAIRSGLQAIDSEASLPGAYVEYEFNGDAWRLWAVCGQTRVVVVSYNCQVSSKGAEDKVVNEIVQSLVVR
jgi:hypothetical protein